MPAIPEPTLEQVTEVVIDELKDIPYPKDEITAASLLGTFFSQVQKQDERNGVPVSRAQIFLRDVKKRIGKTEVFLEDLLDTERYATVGRSGGGHAPEASIKVTTMKPWRALAVLLAVCQITLPLARGQAAGKVVTLDAQWVVQKDEETEKVSNHLNITPLTTEGRLITGNIVQGKPKVELVRLVKRVKDTDTRIGLKLVKAQGSLVRFEPDGTPEKDARYFLFVDTGPDGRPGIVLQQNGTPLTFANPTPVRLANTATPFDRHREFGVKDKKFDPNGALALLSGGDGGAFASGKLDVNVTEVFWDNFLVHAEAKADIALQAHDFAKSFNSVKTDLSLVYINEDKRDWFLFGRGDRQFALAAKFASDRAFETIDMAGSLGAWLTMDNVVTRLISNALFVIGQEKNEPGATALWRLSYDYAAKVASGSGKSARTTEVGENRGVVRLDWPLWIARGIDLTNTPLKSHYAMQLLIEEQGVWDLENSQFLLENKLTLEFSPDEPHHRLDPNFSKPSFSITYLNGKAAPTFRQVDEFLAGFKLPF